MREAANNKTGNLEVRALDGRWIRLSQQNEPHFTEEDDPDNRLYRNFFGVYGLPLSLKNVEFRVAAEPELQDAHQVQIVGFLVIEHKAAIPFVRNSKAGT